MSDRKYRLLLVSSQPIQNPASLRLMAEHPKLDILVAYCSLPNDQNLQASSLKQNPEYLTKALFDIPLLEGYPWCYVPNRSPVPNLNTTFGLINPGLMRLVQDCDVCLVYGYAYVSFWLAIAAAKIARKPLLLSTDATYLDPADGEGGNWKIPIKKKALPYLYNHIADAVLVLSTASKTFTHSLGVPESRIFLTPYVVDNDYIAEIAQNTSRQQVRAELDIPENAVIVVFCAKFIPRKRPQDVIEAFARANIPNTYLVMIGDGPLKADLTSQAQHLGIESKIRFTGLVQYSRLPSLYAASNVLAFSSEYEPYGLPVNEAMICGIPVVISDRIGAAYDLVEQGVTGFTYPCGNIDALATLFQTLLGNPKQLEIMGEAARDRIKTWSPQQHVEGLVKAVETVVVPPSLPFNP